jgi:hypothetical protein
MNGARWPDLYMSEFNCEESYSELSDDDLIVE